MSGRFTPTMALLIRNRHHLLWSFAPHHRCARYWELLTRIAYIGGIWVRRRKFIALAGGVAAWSFAVRAQQPAIPVIGYFSSRSPDAEAPIRVPFLKALEGSGFSTGRNVAIEYRFAEGRDERLPLRAADIELLRIPKRDNFCRLINPEAKIPFVAR